MGSCLPSLVSLSPPASPWLPCAPSAPQPCRPPPSSTPPPPRLISTLLLSSSEPELPPRSCWIWSRNWLRLRISHHRLRQEPFPQATAVLLRYFGIRPVRGHGSVLFDDGFPPPVRFLDCAMAHDRIVNMMILVTCSINSFKEIKLNM